MIGEAPYITVFKEEKSVEAASGCCTKNSITAGTKRACWIFSCYMSFSISVGSTSGIIIFFAPVTMPAKPIFVPAT